MHEVEFSLVEMTLDFMKYAINRITDRDPPLGMPETETELRALVGETITPEGIGGERAFKLFRDVLVKASVSIDHPRHHTFVPGSPTRSAVLFDLVTSASSVHGGFWLEGGGCIFAKNEAMRWLVSLTGLPEGAFGVFTSGGTEANLSAMVTAREDWRHCYHVGRRTFIRQSNGKSHRRRCNDDRDRWLPRSDNAGRNIEEVVSREQKPFIRCCCYRRDNKRGHHR